jgi:adenylate kinase family enzyme
MTNIRIIAIIGPDGSGKTTFSKQLIKKLSKKKILFKYFHLKPNVSKKKTKPVTNPHDQVPRSKIFSFLKICYWLILFRIFFFLMHFSQIRLFIFDRYPHDILIDKIRYRFNLNLNLTKFILKLFPKPFLWINMTGNENHIWNRKKEVSFKVLKSQLRKYRRFVKNKKFINISSLERYEKSINIILDKLKLHD